MFERLTYFNFFFLNSIVFLQTYCGFYKQEVERHLVDVELMFYEMGYKKMPDGLLVLTGPLCMDQVGNVSRDALLAYVECQVIKSYVCLLNNCLCINLLYFTDYE